MKSGDRSAKFIGSRCTARVAALCIITAGLVTLASSASASLCVGEQWQNQGDVMTLSLTNTCERTVDLTLMSPHNRRVCATMRIAPGETREVQQENVCHGGINSLNLGCTCEHQFLEQERVAQ